MSGKNIKNRGELYILVEGGSSDWKANICQLYQTMQGLLV